jgi:hypothetical protein
MNDRVSVFFQKNEFCYRVYNQRELFICLDIMIKNMKVHIEMYLNDGSVLN